MDASDLENLTPHDVIIVVGEKKLVYKKGAKVARISAKQDFIEKRSNGVPVYSHPIFEDFENVPKKLEKSILVSMVVGQFAQDHPEEINLNGYKVYGPDSGDTSIREKGQIVGVTRLIQYLPVKK